MSSSSATAVAIVWLFSALTTHPQGQDGPAVSDINYQSKPSLEICNRDRERMIRAGKTKQYGWYMECLAEPDGFIDPIPGGRTP